MKQHKFNGAQFEANVAVLPELCFAKHLADDSLIIIKRGERGFFPTDPEKYPLGHRTRDQQVFDLNGKLGVTSAQRMAMEMGSMAGFDVPGANPEVHKARALVGDLEVVNEDLAAVGRDMLRNGADYDTIKAYFKSVMDRAAPLREPA